MVGVSRPAPGPAESRWNFLWTTLDRSRARVALRCGARSDVASGHQLCEDKRSLARWADHMGQCQAMGRAFELPRHNTMAAADRAQSRRQRSMHRRQLPRQRARSFGFHRLRAAVAGDEAGQLAAVQHLLELDGSIGDGSFRFQNVRAQTGNPGKRSVGAGSSFGHRAAARRCGADMAGP